VEFKLVLVRTALGAAPAVAELKREGLLVAVEGNKLRSDLRKRFSAKLLMGVPAWAISEASSGAETFKAEVAAEGAKVHSWVELRRRRQSAGFGVEEEFKFSERKV